MSNQTNQEPATQDLEDIESENHRNQTPFDNLEHIRDIKEGIHGIVSLYRDPNDQRLIAVKKFYAPESEDTTGAFHREVLALERLKHPCVLPIIYYIDPRPATDTSLAIPPRIGTLYASNGSLREILNKIENNNPPPFVNDTWLAITVAGIVTGMKFIHNAGWIHRDLKPENILIDENGHPLIGDLGTCRLVDLNVTMTRNVGTPRYLAPEMYEEGRYTNAIDTYAFSLILYELLTKQPVFPKNIQPAPLMRRALDGTRAEIPEFVIPQMREIIQRCWNVDPTQRMSFDEIYEILAGINFKITPNVDEELVKTYVDQVNPKMDINIRLWNGELYPMTVGLFETIVNIRRRISEHTQIPLERIIPSRQGMPLYCCWKHTMDNMTTFNDAIRLLNRDELFRQSHTIELCIDITYFQMGPTKLRIVPKSVNDLLREIKKFEDRNGYSGCQMKIQYRRQEITPSDQNIIEKGITFSSTIVSRRIFNDKVKINHTEIECNLDDPVDDLILRYVTSQELNVDRFIFLEKNGTRLTEDYSLRRNGVVSNDDLTINFIDSDQQCSISYLSLDSNLRLAPDETVLNLIRNASYALKIRIPIFGIIINIGGHNITNYDQTIREAGLFEESYIFFFQRYYSEYHL